MEQTQPTKTIGSNRMETQISMEKTKQIPLKWPRQGPPPARFDAVSAAAVSRPLVCLVVFFVHTLKKPRNNHFKPVFFWEVFETHGKSRLLSRSMWKKSPLPNKERATKKFSSKKRCKSEILQGISFLKGAGGCWLKADRVFNRVFQKSCIIRF